MPEVKKQSARPAPARAAPAPSPNGPAEPGDGIKLLVYGGGKTGKTRLADSFPAPRLLIGTEDGTKSICDLGPKGRVLKKVLACGAELHALILRGKFTGTDFVKLARTEWFDELTPLVLADGYRTVIVDTAGGVQDMLLKEVLGLDDVPVQKSWGMTDRQTWGIIGQQLKERIGKLLHLADAHGTNVVTIAHERNFKTDEDARQGTDVAFPSVGPALTPSAAGWLNGAHDYICQTFIREQVVVEKNPELGEGFETRTKTGKMEFCLRVGPHPLFMTGFRMTPGAADLPDLIVDPSFAKVMQVIRGEALEKPAKTR